MLKRVLLQDKGILRRMSHQRYIMYCCSLMMMILQLTMRYYIKYRYQNAGGGLKGKEARSGGDMASAMAAAQGE